MLFNQELVLAGQKSIEGKMYKVVNNKHVPYDSTAEVLATITATRRHIGQVFRVVNQAGDGIDDWHFVGGIADGNLVEKVGGSGMALETAATYSAISLSTDKRFVLVTADETNNGDMSLYLYTGTALKFLQTIA
jgi:hypothetical protein